ncbi:hypothetical protein [Rhodoferax sp.]|uniref:hypothetical protein n=1 Tax=Rhodoferax sp. TaxID=50421 RepID=UPI0025E60F70|nr:hypothetical protein [Rhodoferax sp.]
MITSFACIEPQASRVPPIQIVKSSVPFFAACRRRSIVRLAAMAHEQAAEDIHLEALFALANHLFHQVQQRKDRNPAFVSLT